MSLRLPPVKPFPQQPQSGGGEAPLGTAMLLEMPDRLQNIPHSITLSAYIVAMENDIATARVSAGDIRMRPSVPLLKGKPLLVQLAPGNPPTFAVLYSISRVGATADSPLAPSPPASAPKPPPPATSSGQTTPGNPSFAVSGFGALLEVQENTPQESPTPKPIEALEESSPDPEVTLDT